MRKKIFMMLAFVSIIVFFYIFMKFYTKAVRDSVIQEYKSKYIVNSNRKEFDYKKKKIIHNNDVNFLLLDNFNRQSYDSVIRTDTPQKALIYSLVVSNKWNYYDASLNVFYSIAELNDKNKFADFPNLDFLDKKTIDFAIIYLKKAADEKSLNAMHILGYYYIEGKYIEKNEFRGKKLLKDAKELSNGVLE